jgi:hypothetical protein
MPKIRLMLDALVVESFHTAADLPLRGTVHGRGDSGDSECPNCWSAEPCTGIPIETCTCGCEPVTGEPSPEPYPADPSGCAATSPCTCIPIETCSCGMAGYG